MDFAFPPPPPDTNTVLAARLVLAFWALIGLAILIWRMRNKKSIHRREIIYWLLAIPVSGVVASFGHSRFTQWDDNHWLTPAVYAACSVSVAGVTIGLAKVYENGSEQRLEDVFKTACIVLPLTLLLGYAPLNIKMISCPPPATSWCRTNGLQLGHSIQTIAETTQTFPPASSGDTPTSWRILVLPHLDAASIYRTYDQNQAWSHPPNDEFASVSVPAMTCLANYYPHDAQGRRYAAFSMPTGAHTIGDNPKGTRFADVTDGISNTLLFVEASGAQIVWTEPRDVNVATHPVGINLNGSKPGHSSGLLSSYHRHSVNVIFGNGSVQRLSHEIDLELLKKLITIDGNETIRPDERF